MVKVTKWQDEDMNSGYISQFLATTQYHLHSYKVCRGLNAFLMAADINSPANSTSCFGVVAFTS